LLLGADGVRPIFRQCQPCGRQLCALGREALVEELGAENAIDAEIAEILPQFAPRAEQRHVDVIGHCDWTNGPLRVMASLVDIRDRHLARLVDRTAQFRRVDPGKRRRVAVRDINRRGDEKRLQRLRHHHRELGEDAFRRLLKFRIAQTAKEAHADRDRIGLPGGEHQWRQIKTAPQCVTEPGRALDRHAAGLEGGDVAIDRANRHLQFLCERRGGDRLGSRAQ